MVAGESQRREARDADAGGSEGRRAGARSRQPQGSQHPRLGIGSLTQALGGDRAGSEAGTQKVLVETTRAKIANMLTANAQDIEKRIKEGFLALLMQGPTADETIKIGPLRSDANCALRRRLAWRKEREQRMR